MLAAAMLVMGCGRSERPRNAVLIVLDTLRADRVSAYGHERRTTPVIDELAERGLLFESTVSNASWTLPAMVGMLTGQFPSRAEYDSGLRYSLVEQLRESGWQTAGFAGGGFAGRNYGIDRGFEKFQEQDPAGMVPFQEGPEKAGKVAGAASPPSEIEKTFAAAQRWLEQNHEEPFFLMVHTFEPHTPYDRPIYAEGMQRGVVPETFGVSMAALIKNGHPGFDMTPVELAYISALYDGGVTFSDRFVGELLDALDRLGVAEETLVVVTADHGEDLGERDPSYPGIHGHALWDSLILVPLVIFDPTREYPTSRVSAQVRLIDVMPTILDLLGAKSDHEGAGRSLLPLMEGRQTEDRVAWSVIDKHSMFKMTRSQYAVRSPTHKLIVTPGTTGGEEVSVELYDLTSDPGEEVNLATEQAERAQTMMVSLKTHLDRLREEGAPKYRRKEEIDPKVQRRLRELGYIE